MKNTKKILSTFLALLMIITIIPMSINASAATYTGTCGDNLTWSYDDSTYVLTISGTGAMRSYSLSDRAWETYEDSIKTVVIEDGVTTIGQYAFYDFSSVTSVTIPDSVTSICEAAFYYCTSLASITIPDSVTSIGSGAFEYCTSLTSITIPDSVTSIGDWAFSYCTSLTSITIPDSVTSIGSYAFAYCTSLTSITVDSNNQYYSSDEYGALFNKDKTTLIQYPIGNTRTSIAIPDTVISISDYAFYNSTSLISITIPDSVTSIGSYAFRYCTSLTSITIPDSVTSIGGYAFAYCTSLTTVTILDSVTTIGNGAFCGCTSLTSITIPDSVTSISYEAFSRCTSLTSVTIPDSVTSIGSSAFAGCTSLTDVYYVGTEEQWNSITIDNTNERNTPLLNATIHYNFCAHNYVAVTTEPTCTEQGYTTYTCACGDSYVDNYVDALGHNYENGACAECDEADPDYYVFSIQTPSTTTISKKNGIILHANIEGNAPAGSYVVWTASNNKFTTSTVDEDSLKIISNKNGYTTFTATLYDADGNVLATDTIEMRSKAGFFDVIASWFRKATVYER